jgi:hypothetical protein
MGAFSRKFKVSPSVCRSRNYAAWRRFARNPNAIPVASSVRLKFNKGWFPDREFAPHLYPVSGRHLLNLLTEWRSNHAA